MHSYIFNFKMKDSKIKFIKMGVLFLAILLILILAINLAYTNLVLKKTSTYQQEMFNQEYLDNLTSNTLNFVFLGDSHNQVAVEIYTLSDSINYGYGGDNYIKLYYKLKRLIDKNINVKNIVLETDISSFSTYSTANGKILDQLFIYSKFIPYDDITKLRKQSSMSNWIEAHFPVFGNGPELKFIFFGKAESGNFNNGWVRLDGNLSSGNKTAAAELTYEIHFKDQDLIDVSQMEYFSKILELAKAKGINVVLIKYPLAKEYDSLLANNLKSAREEYYDDIFLTINSTLGANYAVLDYSDLFFDYPDYFSDAEHLNYLGAEVFSKKLSIDLKEFN